MSLFRRMAQEVNEMLLEDNLFVKSESNISFIQPEDYGLLQFLLQSYVNKL